MYPIARRAIKHNVGMGNCSAKPSQISRIASRPVVNSICSCSSHSAPASRPIGNVRNFTTDGPDVAEAVAISSDIKAHRNDRFINEGRKVKKDNSIPFEEAETYAEEELNYKGAARYWITLSSVPFESIKTDLKYFVKTHSRHIPIEIRRLYDFERNFTKKPQWVLGYSTEKMALEAVSDLQGKPFGLFKVKATFTGLHRLRGSSSRTQYGLVVRNVNPSSSTLSLMHSMGYLQARFHTQIHDHSKENPMAPKKGRIEEGSAYVFVMFKNETDRSYNAITTPHNVFDMRTLVVDVLD